jgi:hypothetical protein
VSIKLLRLLFRLFLFLFPLFLFLALLLFPLLFPLLAFWLVCNEPTIAAISFATSWRIYAAVRFLSPILGLGIKNLGISLVVLDIACDNT